MLRTNSLRAVFSLPAAFAVALAAYAGSAFANPAAQIAALNLKLQAYAVEEGKTGAAVTSYNVTTATADDLVYAVYELVQAAGDDPAKIADIAEAALLPAVQAATPSADKVRADKDKVVGRIMEAAVVASSTSGANGAVPVDQATIVDKLLQQVGTVNSGLGTAKALTAAGKELLVAKALRSTSRLGGAIADRVQTSGFYPTASNPAATDLARTAFNVAVLKLLAYKPQTNDPTAAATAGTYFPIIDGAPKTVIGEPAFVEGTPPSIFGVRDYIAQALLNYPGGTSKATAAFNIASGVAATVPAAAGATIAGYVKDFQTAGATDAQIISYLQGSTPATGIIGNAKLAAAVSDIVADSFKLLSAQPTNAQVTSFVTGQTAANKGKIASGLIRANPTNATAITNDVLGADLGVAGKGITSTGIAAFAGAAAQGLSGNAVRDLTSAAVLKIPYVTATGASPTPAAVAAAAKADNAKIEAVAIAVGKAVSLVDPDSVAQAVDGLFAVSRNGSNPYSTAGPSGEPARQLLAADLAKGLATNYAGAGAAVAGVITQAFSKNAPANATAAFSQASEISASAIKAAPKATVSIALKVAHSAAVSGFFSGPATSSQFAAALAANTNVASTNAGAVAAGVSLADTANTGAITAAVINSGAVGTPNYNARQAAALTIANTVAINVDVEAIGLIAQSVGALLQPVKNADGTTNLSKLPKVTTGISALATSLAKAINTKPLVSWGNRVDELGELAAELTKQYLAKAGVANSGVPDGTDPSQTAANAEVKTLATALSSIGANVFKAVSAKLLADTGNFQADVKDIARNVSGAIAQVIANSSLPVGTKDLLLSTTYNAATSQGLLAKNLMTGATAAKADSLVKTAFDNVSGTKTGGVYGNYVDLSGGNVTRADSSVGRYETGVNYETGNVTANETPVKNL